MTLIHWLAHLTGWNMGKTVQFQLNGEWYVGFRCTGCGNISDIKESIVQ